MDSVKVVGYDREAKAIYIPDDLCYYKVLEIECGEYEERFYLN
jgi:hypothetical protein